VNEGKHKFGGLPSLEFDGRLTKFDHRVASTMLKFLCIPTARLGTRSYPTQQPGKVSVKLIAELGKLTEGSIVKAREALAATNNDVEAALEWLQKFWSPQKNAAKVVHIPLPAKAMRVCRYS